MIQLVAPGATVIKELVGALSGVVEDGDTYKKLDGLRAFVSQVTGVEIDKGAFVTFMETATQGEAYTGEWEFIGPKQPDDVPETRARRLRVAGGWIYDIGRGNAIPIRDK